MERYKKKKLPLAKCPLSLFYLFLQLFDPGSRIHSHGINPGDNNNTHCSKSLLWSNFHSSLTNNGSLFGTKAPNSRPTPATFQHFGAVTIPLLPEKKVNCPASLATFFSQSKLQSDWDVLYSFLLVNFGLVSI